MLPPALSNPTVIFKYNPHRMREEDILTTFMGRKELLSRLLTHLREQHGKKKPEHLFLFGPRGIGKTTMLLVLRQKIAEDPGLCSAFDILQFSEEERRISGLATFAVRILELLADRRNNAGKALEEAHKTPDRAMEILLKTAARPPGKKVLLLADNFDEIAVAVTAKKTARSRGKGTQPMAIVEAFLQSPSFIVVATAIQSPLIRRNFPKHLLRFFKPPIPLAPIDDGIGFLMKRAEKDRRKRFLDNLPQLSSRIEGLTRLAGGNPRLLVFLYECLGHKPLFELVEIVQKMVDDLTPMYQDVIDRFLNRGQAAVLEVLAAMGGVGTLKTLASQTFQDEQTVRTFLADLCHIGLVVRSGDYKLEGKQVRRPAPEIFRTDPPLFQIWYEMRYLNSNKSLYLVRFFSLLSTPDEVRALKQELHGVAVAETEAPLAEMLEHVADILDPEWDEIWDTNVLETLRSGGTLGDSLQKLDDAILQVRVRSGRRKVGLLVARSYVRRLRADAAGADADLKEAEKLALQSKEVETIIKILVAQSRYLLSIGDTEKALEAANDAENRCNTLSCATAHTTRAIIFLAQSAIHYARSSYKQALESAEEALKLMESTKEPHLIARAEHVIGNIKLSSGEYQEARKHYEKSFKTYLEIDNRLGQANLLDSLGTLCASMGDFTCGREHHEKSLAIQQEIGDRRGQASSLCNLGNDFQSMGDYKRARDCYEKSLAIQQEIGDRSGQATSLGNLGNVLLFFGDYEGACKYHEKSIAIHEKTGDRSGQAGSMVNLGTVYTSMGDYERAHDCYQKSLAIQQEIGDRNGQAGSLCNLGNVRLYQGDYKHAREHYEKSLSIHKKIGDRSGIAISLGNLGNICASLSDYEHAREYYEKSLAIQQETGDRRGQASSLGNLGNLFQALGDVMRAREYCEKSLAIQQEIEDRRGQASSLNNLGNLFQALGDVMRAREYCEKSLAIQQEIEDRRGQATSFLNLGTIYMSQGDHKRAREHLEKSFSIQQEIGDRNGQASSLGRLGIMYASIGEYGNARENIEKSLAIHQEIGNLSGQAISLMNLGAVYASQGDYERARNYFEKAHDLFRSLGERPHIRQAATNLVGALFALAAAAMRAGEFARAEEYFGKTASFAQDAGAEGMLTKFLAELAVPCLRQSRDLAGRLLVFLESLAAKPDFPASSGPMKAAKAALRFYATGELPSQVKDLGPAEIFLVQSLIDRIKRPFHTHARDLIKANKPAEAAAALQRILNKSPDDVDALLNLFYIRLAEERLDEAESLAKRAHHAQPDLEQTVENLAEIDRRRGNRSEAIRRLRKLIEKNPSNQTAYSPLTKDLRQEGRFEELSDILRKWQDIADDPLIQESLRVRLPEADILAGQVNRAQTSMPPVDFCPRELSLRILLGLLRVLLDLQRKDAASARKHAADTLKTAVEGPPGRTVNPLNPELAKRVRDMLGDNEWEFFLRLAEAIAQQEDPREFSSEMLDEIQAQELARLYAEEEESALLSMKQGRIQGFRDLLRTTTRSIGPGAAIRAFGEHYSDYSEQTQSLLIDVFISAIEEGKPVEVTAALHAVGESWPKHKPKMRARSIQAMLSLASKSDTTPLNREQAINLLNVLYPNLTDHERRQVRDGLERLSKTITSPGLAEFFDHTVPIVEKGEQ